MAQMKGGMPSEGDKAVPNTSFLTIAGDVLQRRGEKRREEIIWEKRRETKIREEREERKREREEDNGTPVYFCGGDPRRERNTLASLPFFATTIWKVRYKHFDFLNIVWKIPLGDDGDFFICVFQRSAFFVLVRQHSFQRFLVFSRKFRSSLWKSAA